MKNKNLKLFLSSLVLSFLFTGLTANSADASPVKTIKNSVGMELNEVKAGTFIYGSPKETERPNLWFPRFQTKIALTKDFYLGKYEVTQEQFEKVMGTNPSKFKNPQAPVDSVTWDEAVEFCKKLSDMPEEKAAGRVYSLPSSAEWEYACRAGTESIFPWGNEDETVIGKHAVCRDWHGARATQTEPVGKKEPNNWGFHDMLGNIWEWCSDGTWTGSMQTGTYYAKELWTDPHWPIDPKQRIYSPVIRGGAWNSDFRSANSWNVSGQRPLARENDTGFRLKCSIEK